MKVTVVWEKVIGSGDWAVAEVKVNQVVAEVEAGVQMKDKVTVVIIKWE